MRMLLFTILIFGCVACENALVNEELSVDQAAIFIQLWEDYDRNYSGFTVRDIEWNSVRSESLDQINTGLSQPEFFDLLGDVLLNFEDIHSELTDASGRIIRYIPENPRSLNHIGPFENYLETVMRINQTFTYGIISNENIGYIHIPSFSSSISLQEFEQIDQIIQNLEDIQGLIIDLRNNSGGEASNQKAIAKRFIDQSFVYIRSQFRNGPDHDDFDEPIEDVISPQESVQFIGPIVVLTNRACASATEILIMTLATQDHVAIVGDTTSGGLGLNTWRELPNGWNYRMTITLTSNNEGISFESTEFDTSVVRENELILSCYKDVA